MTEKLECVICADAGRSTPATSGRCCDRCRDRLAANLNALGDLVAQASFALIPTNTATGLRSPGFASRPPLNVDAIDPELATIYLWNDDPTSNVPILEMLEMWERIVREHRNLAAYGPASSARTEPTFTGTTQFLRRNLDFITHDPRIALADFAQHINSAHRVLSRWNIDKDPSSWGLACPNTRDDGSACGAWINWERGAASTRCRRCNREWNVDWLMRVADEVWLDSDTIAHLTGVPRRTIQYWGQHGKVARRGLLYRLNDITGASQRDVAT